VLNATRSQGTCAPRPSCAIRPGPPLGPVCRGPRATAATADRPRRCGGGGDPAQSTAGFTYVCACVRVCVRWMCGHTRTRGPTYRTHRHATAACVYAVTVLVHLSLPPPILSPSLPLSDEASLSLSHTHRKSLVCAPSPCPSGRARAGYGVLVWRGFQRVREREGGGVGGRGGRSFSERKREHLQREKGRRREREREGERGMRGKEEREKREGETD
jgi:hypothetical protein